jgi:hypothetical protein
MEARAIFILVAYGLLLLGGASGVVLFLRAAFGSSQASTSGNKETLWGLFIVGLLAGLILLAIGAHR